MDNWKRLYEAAAKEYHPEEVSPFVYAHHVVCALEADNGEIYTGFCIEACSGVMNLCAERVAGLNMYMQSGQTKVRRMIAFRDRPPCGESSGMRAARAGSSSISSTRKTRIWRSWSITQSARP